MQEVKMEDLGIKNMSAYIRKMSLDGYCVRLDIWEATKDIMKEMAAIK